MPACFGRWVPLELPQAWRAVGAPSGLASSWCQLSACVWAPAGGSPCSQGGTAQGQGHRVGRGRQGQDGEVRAAGVPAQAAVPSDAVPRMTVGPPPRWGLRHNRVQTLSQPGHGRGRTRAGSVNSREHLNPSVRVLGLLLLRTPDALSRDALSRDGRRRGPQSSASLGDGTAQAHGDRQGMPHRGQADWLPLLCTDGAAASGLSQGPRPARPSPGALAGKDTWTLGPRQ